MGIILQKLVFKSGSESLRQVPPEITLFDFNVIDIDGKPFPLKLYKNKAKCIIVVNVACKCGYTSVNYQQLVALYEKYHSKGLQILAFPCNQFFSQEKGNPQEIKQFVKQKFSVNFPMFEKIQVNGVNTHPLYQYLRKNSELYDPNNKTSKVIPWNFSKFILDQNGKVVKFAGPSVNPNDLIPTIEKQLQAKL